ncbi:MAG TPA: hypothetical protein VGN93_04425 [Shinella sp.]|jgi:hypothetical protein|uniref:hypothetical protein n=1 Tax=Shinella sp. TaxID=1870904 RepID=UPI002E129016|nr:hypothetical protein [Shinella sp.]
MTDTDTKTTTSRQPEFMAIDYENMLILFYFADLSKPFEKRFHLPIKAVNSMAGCSIFVDEDDIKKLCLEENHSLADFEAIRLGIKSFLRDQGTYVVNGNQYHVCRDEVLCGIVETVIKGERVPKAEAAPESEAA